MRSGRTDQTTLLIALAVVLALSSGLPGAIARPLLLAAIVLVVAREAPRRLRAAASGRRLRPGVQLLRHLATASGPASRLQWDVVDAYARSAGGPAPSRRELGPAPRLAEIGRVVDRASGLDAADAAVLLSYVGMMRRSRERHPPLVEDLYETVSSRLGGSRHDRGTMSSVPATTVPAGYVALRALAAHGLHEPSERLAALLSGPRPSLDPDLADSSARTLAALDALGAAHLDAARAGSADDAAFAGAASRAVAALEDDARLQAARARTAFEVHARFVTSRHGPGKGPLDPD